MSIQKGKFSIGDVVKHKHFDFRGVIYDVDFEFNNSDVLFRDSFTSDCWISLSFALRISNKENLPLDDQFSNCLIDWLVNK